MTDVASAGSSRPWKFLGSWFALWIAVGVFFASESVVRRFPGEPGSAASWGHALRVHIAFFLVWAVVSLPVPALARRFPIRGPRRWNRAALHLALSAVAASVQLAVAGSLFEALRIGWGAELPFGRLMAFAFPHDFHRNLLTYWAVVFICHLRDYDQGLREKSLVESRLREQLARAELEALRMQVHPHFLFNALHSISSLIDSDPAAADAMLVRLARLLRRSLDDRSAATVPLEREIEFARCYLELATMRYAERIHAEISADPSVGRVEVPTFILQPLVENAVLHGVEASAKPCSVRLRARGERDRLVVEVENDVPAKAPNRREGGGVGLSNVRARLLQIYGSAASFQFDLEPGRRALARIVLPLPPREAALEEAS